MGLRLAFAALGIAASAILVEVALHFAPVATGYGYLPLNVGNPVLRGTPFARYTYSLGWNFREVTHGNLNNEGFIADRDYFDSEAGSVLIIGDSYVQAAPIPEAQNLHAVMARKLQPVEVIGLSRSGGSLPDYLAMARWGILKYHPVAVVFVIVTGDVADSVKLKPDGYYFRRTSAGLVQTRVDRPMLSPVKKALNRSKLFRYLYDNLAFAQNLHPLVVGGGDKFSR